jgi:nucleoside-diphosphate-sugar epimerase
MLVAIAGGHGNVALRLARLLHERGDQVRSLIRSADQADEVRAAGAEPVECDLESANEAQVAMALGSADAVVFAAGAGPGSGPERKWTVDYGGAVKLIAAAHADGIRRYVMVSSMGADSTAEGDDTASVYFRTKGQADDELQASGLDYTIVRPGGLTNDPGTGRVRIGAHVGRGRISRDDVAVVLAGSLHEPATVRKLFEVVSGDVPVEEALRSLGAR